MMMPTATIERNARVINGMTKRTTVMWHKYLIKSTYTKSNNYQMVANTSSEFQIEMLHEFASRWR